MEPLTIIPATTADADALDTALRRLAADLDDPYRANADRLAAALSGPEPACHALMARPAGAADQVAGVALFAPQFSTIHGVTGVHVSDLWVAPERRGTRLGVRLLASVRDHAARRWGAGFMRLAVYADNTRARAFYDRLGFRPNPEETYLTLTGPALAALKGAP